MTTRVAGRALITLTLAASLGVPGWAVALASQQAAPSPSAESEAQKAERLAAERAATKRVMAERAARKKAEEAAAKQAGKPKASATPAPAAAAPSAQAAPAQAPPAQKAAPVTPPAEDATAKAKAEEASRAKAEEAARAEARRRAEDEAARAKAEAGARAKAEEAARAEAKRRADDEAARAKAEERSRANAEEAARREAKRLADEEAAAKAKAEQSARLEAQRRADEEAAAKGKADEVARREAKRAADEQAAREAAAKAEQQRAERAAAAENARAERQAKAEAAARARVEAAERQRAERAARLESQRLAREEAERRATQAAKEQQLRDQAALQAYAEAAAPEDLGTVTGVLGSGLMLNWPEASKRIAIADETIATFHVVSPREVAIYGIKPGRTTVFVWLSSGRRLFYRLLVEHNLEPARVALRSVDPGIVLESGPDGESVVLRGEVSSDVAARQARALAEQLIPRGTGGNVRIVNLIRYAGGIGTPEDRLTAAMASVDPRIQVRWIQAGAEPSMDRDSCILDGTVRDVNAVVQAVMLADRHLGGNGKTVKAADEDRVAFQRSAGGSSGGTGGLQGGEPPKNGISAQLARGLMVTSESGRVVSFLKVESLPQVLVAIRVLEVDRNKARRMGLDIRADGKKFSVGNFTIPGGGGLTDLRGTSSTLAGAGNLVGSYVDKTIAIASALDLMTEKQVARSVAEPNILSLSGEQASVLVGGEVPIPTTTSTQVSSSAGFFFQQFGIRLDIRPTVDAGELITLEVAPSIVSPSAGLGNGNVPGFRIQRVETTARVQAGESLILGGLLSSTESVQERGLPLLGKIPLFRWQRKSLENLELLFVITPRIIVPPSDPVRLPSLDFAKNPTTPIGLSGLNEEGIPYTFEAQEASIAGDATSCVEMRERPAAESKLMDCLVPGTAVRMLEAKRNWRRILLPNATNGWVKVEGLSTAKPVE